MSEEDVRIGQSIARYRGDRSQVEIANAMRLAGWKWAQNTVSSVEAGERPLRLAEARDLARILGMESLGEMFRQDEYTVVRSWAHKTTEAHQELIDAAKSFEIAQVNLAMAGDAALQAGVAPTNAVIAPLESWLRMNAADVVRQSMVKNGHEPETQKAFMTLNERGANGGHWVNTLYRAYSTTWNGGSNGGEHSEEA